MIERERETETQAEGKAGSMHQEPDVGLDPGSPGLHPGPKTGALRRCDSEINSGFLKDKSASGGRKEVVPSKC